MVHAERCAIEVQIGKLNLTSGERDRLVRRRAASVEVYELLPRSREHTTLRTRGGNLAAHSLAQAAIAIAPNYATAYALIAFTHLDDYANGFGSDSKGSLRIGLELAGVR
jgi:adenylate cyclase